MQYGKFSEGQRVRLLPDMRATKLRRDDAYRIIRLMPQEGHLNYYRIKHESDPFERVVSEVQIVCAAENGEMREA